MSQDARDGVCGGVPELGQRAGSVELDPSRGLFPKVNARWSPVQTNTHNLKFVGEDVSVLIVLLARAVEHHEHQVCGSSNGNDFAATPTALCSTLDDSWQIKHLNFGVVDDHVAWNARQGRKLVGRGLALGVRHSVEQ